MCDGRRNSLTFRFAAQQYVNAAEYVDSLGNGRSTGAHGSPVASNASYAVFPAFSVLSATLAFGNKSSEFGTAVIVLDLERRQAGNDVVSVREELSHEAYGQGRQSRGQKPCARRVVGSCRRRCVSHDNEITTTEAQGSFLEHAEV